MRRIWTSRTCLSAIPLLLTLLATNVSYPQHAIPSGKEVYDHLGCWNCHGRTGQEGRQALPIGNTSLPLRRFIGYTRMPNGIMPPYAPQHATSRELEIVYGWLKGVDTATIPPKIEVGLIRSPQVRIAGTDGVGFEIRLRTVGREGAIDAGVLSLASLGYRVTLITNGKAPETNQLLEYQPAGTQEWSKFRTDANGEVMLGFGDQAIAIRNSRNASAQIRLALPVVRTVLVIELLNIATPTNPVVLGVETAMVDGRLP